MLNLVLLLAVLGQSVELTLPPAAESDPVPQPAFILPTLHVGLVKGTTLLEGALDQGSTPAAVVFLPDRPMFMVSLLANHDDRAETKNGVRRIPLDAEWWKGLTLAFDPLPVPSYPADGDPIRFTSDAFTEVVTAAVDAKRRRLDDATALRVFDKAWARFRVPALPAGNYIVTAALDPAVVGGVSMFPGNHEIIAVRSGRENTVLYRMYLHEAAKGKSFEEYSPIILELTKLEPDNATLWEGLANVSIGRVSAAQTLEYYDRAYEVFSRNVAKMNKPLSEEDREYAAFLTLYRRIYPVFIAQRDAFALEQVVERGAKTFVVIDRATGKKIRALDPASPELPPRVDR